MTRPIWFAPFLLACAAALSYVYADRTMPIPDEGALLVAAGKILHGGVFYRDIDAYAFPGVSYLLAGVMSIFGEHLSVARGVAGAIYCLTLLGVYASAIALMNPRRAALCGLSLLSLKFFAFPIYTMFFYADASVAAAILALALFLRHRFDGASTRLFWVGVLAGLSIVTKQSTGILVAVVFALVLAFPAFAHGPRRREHRLAEVAGYGAGLFLVIAGMSMYFAAHGVFGDMMRGGLLRPFTGYLPTSGVSFAPPISWWDFGALKAQALVYYPQAYLELALNGTRPGDGARLFYLRLGEVIVRVLYSVIPILFLACTALWIRAWRRSPIGDVEAEISDAAISSQDEESALARARFFSTAGITLAIVVSAFPRADFIHIITTYPAVALIGFALCRSSMLGGPNKNGDVVSTKATQARRLHIEAGLVALLLASTSFFAIRYDATLSHRLSTERAEVWVRARDAWLAPMVRYVQDEIPKGESFFVYGHEAHWYYLTDRYTERPFSQLYPGMTGDEDGAELAKLIRETRPQVIAQGVLRWPGTPSLLRYTGKLRRTMNELYELDPDAIENPPIPRIMSLWRLREK